MTLSHRYRQLALGVALAGINAAAVAAGKPDAARMWEQFLASRADYSEVVTAYDVLVPFQLDAGNVEAEACTAHAQQIRAAVAKVPVSIALRRLAYLCADATGDDAAAQAEAQALASLVRRAMDQAGPTDLVKPIQVVVPADAYALLLLSGMEEQYEYYTEVRPGRYFPLVLVGWDADAQVERHLAFDYVDVMHRMQTPPQFRGMPIQREWIAAGFLEGGSNGRLLAAIDLLALRAAASTGVIADKVAKVRGAAQAGGLQSSRVWLLVCAGAEAPKGCSEGLVEALLAQAEQKRAAAMALLAYAYLDGVGVRRDEQAAWSLLDAADQRWPGGALIEVASMWRNRHDGAPLPRELQRRLDASRSGEVALFRAMLEMRKDKPELDKEAIAFLSAPQHNGVGMGYALLANYYARREDAAQSFKWREKAADAGDAESQALYASALLNGDEAAGLKPDVERARAYAIEAAQGGDGWAGRWLSFEQLKAENFEAAEGWLLGPADAGEIDSIMYLAELYAEERKGVTGGLDRAIGLYTMLAGLDAQGAPARRVLADYALQGRGMAKDPAKALQWLRADAEAGDADSQLALGLHHLNGDFGKVDEKEGRRWVERAREAGLEDAVTGYGSWLFYEKDTAESRAQALRLLAEGSDKGNIGASNNYAWILCTSPRTELYDPKRGMEIARRLGNVETMSAGAVDTVAACHAANGEFARAVELQARAARELAAFESPRSKQERNGKPAGYEKRLKLYREGKRYEEFDRNE